MSGLSFSEFFLLCLIGLIVLGPKRLPQVASQIGTWIGQARRMTRVMRRQLEEELDLDRHMNIRPPAYKPPSDDDTYSPLHDKPSTRVAGFDVDKDEPDTDEPAAAAVPDAADEDDSTAELTTLDVEDTGKFESDSEHRKDA
jgi:sec-independent protein translocase protein TatB